MKRTNCTYYILVLMGMVLKRLYCSGKHEKTGNFMSENEKQMTNALTFSIISVFRSY